MADDPYRISDQVDDEMLGHMVARLEERGRHPRFQAMIDDYLSAVRARDAAEVLDLGCGTGVIARRIAALDGFRGHVTALDLSAALVDRAGALARAEGLSDRIDFATADIRSLALDPDRFDLTVLHTLVSHLEDPAQALQEAARVTRPGGAIVVFDGDYASSTLETADPDRAAALDQAMIDATVTQPRVMRRLPRMAGAAGLRVERCFSYVIAEAGTPDFFAGLIDGIGPMLAASGLCSQEEADGITADLKGAARDGTFFGACNYYGYVLRKP